MEWGTRGKASVLVGGQFGSEGKGLAAAWLARQIPHMRLVLATTSAGANSGHTTKYRDGGSFVCYHLPTTAVVLRCTAYLNAGSIIDPGVLGRELDALDMHEHVIIHPHAAVINDEHRLIERAPGSSTEKLSSTQKGVGAALAGKVMRRDRLAGDHHQLARFVGLRQLNTDLNEGGYSIVVEVPQGTGLSLNHGLSYPYCTSRDAYVMSGLSDAGIHASFLGPTCMVVRTFPIRVGNIMDAEGKNIGQSGPFYPDGTETSWQALDVEPELTTVTKRVRRVSTWSRQQYREALYLNRPTAVFVNFCNYFQHRSDLYKLITSMELDEWNVLGYNVNKAFGFGPCVEDVTESLNEAFHWYDRRSF